LVGFADIRSPGNFIGLILLTFGVQVISLFWFCQNLVSGLFYWLDFSKIRSPGNFIGWSLGNWLVCKRKTFDFNEGLTECGIMHLPKHLKFSAVLNMFRV